MALQLMREDRDAPDDVATVQSASTRAGVTTSGTLTAKYFPREYLNVNLSYQQQQRTSSGSELQDYDAQIVSAGITLLY
jgi:hypothetical protein